MRSKATRSSLTIAAAIFGVVLFGTAPTSLAQECPTGSDEILRLTNWTAEEGLNGSARITFGFENISDTPLRMVDARAWFSDVLGQSIGGIRLTPDIALTPGEGAEETKLMAGFGRVVTMAADDVGAIICADAVVWADGSEERFD